MMKARKYCRSSIFHFKLDCVRKELGNNYGWNNSDLLPLIAKAVRKTQQFEMNFFSPNS
jgi:hypothetical protein